MKTLEEFLTPTQEELFKAIRKMYGGAPLVRKEAYALVKGDAPIMLLAHLDTVHDKPVKDLCVSQDGDVLMSPQGIGGDDRCGVYALVSAYAKSKVKPWLLFTCDEECGGLGAEFFAEDYTKKRLPKKLREVKLLVEIDRKGSNDAVYYSCGNSDFEKYITSKGFETDYGSFSDISIVAPAMMVAAVNLSSGYYNAHTKSEYIVRSQLENTIDRVVSIVEDACNPDFPKYEYIKTAYSYSGAIRPYGGWSDYDDDWYKSYKYGNYSGYTKEEEKKATCLQEISEDDNEYYVPNDLPDELVPYYATLLDFYTVDELEELRDRYGDQAIRICYESEFGKLEDEYDDEPTSRDKLVGWY